MRRFDTTGLEPEVATLLRGMDPCTIKLAEDDAAFQRLTAFHDAVYDDTTPVELSQADGRTAVFGRACMSAVSLDGWLIGARMRQTTPGDHIEGPFYAVATASIYTDEAIAWRMTDHERNPVDDSLELVVEPGEAARPLLSLVDESLSPLDKARAVIARQEEEERRKLTSIRVRIGSRVAWQLLRQNYVTEPLQSTLGFLTSVPNARGKGFVPTEQNHPQSLSQQTY